MPPPPLGFSGLKDICFLFGVDSVSCPCLDNFLKQDYQGPVPLYELEQEVCRIAKNLTSWQFLTIRLSPTIIHEAFPKTVKKSPRPLKRPLRIIKKLLRTITTCQKFNKMPPRNSQDAVKNYQHILIYSNQ